MLVPSSTHLVVLKRPKISGFFPSLFLSTNTSSETPNVEFNNCLLTTLGKNFNMVSMISIPANNLAFRVCQHADILTKSAVGLGRTAGLLEIS